MNMFGQGGAAHLGMLAVSGLGLSALALASEQYGAYVLGREPSAVVRWLARAVGGALLGVACAWGVVAQGVGLGTTWWLGWLCVAALLLVFALPLWPWQPPAPHRPARRGGAAVDSPAAVGDSRVRRAAGAVLLVATVGVFAVLLLRAQEQQTDNPALQGKIGPWTFTLEESDHDAPEIVAMGVPMKTFRLRFCEACDTDIRSATLKVNRPRGPQATGMAFMGQRWDRKAEIPLPSTLRADSELWLTVVGKDGSVYQIAWRMDQVSPATVAWFEQERKLHGPL